MLSAALRRTGWRADVVGGSAWQMTSGGNGVVLDSFSLPFMQKEHPIQSLSVGKYDPPMLVRFWHRLGTI
jgi:hypothetical protein